MKSTRSQVDPELLPLLDAWPQRVISQKNLHEARLRRLPLAETRDCGVEWFEQAVPGPLGEVPVVVRIYRLRNLPPGRGCIFHIHGGGFVLGAIGDMEANHRPLAANLGCTIVTVGYRLAPETPFPGAVEECYEALAWTFCNAKALGIDTRRIGVMGESAGGGLAAALALLTRDRGEYRLSFQHLIYPMLDDRTCVRKPHPFAGEFVWPLENNKFGWTALLGQKPGGSGISPYASPARAKDLSGLPATYISTGALDLFVEEDTNFAMRLIRAGVPTELHVWPGAFHGFDLAPGSKVGDTSRAASVAALRKFLRAI